MGFRRSQPSSIFPLAVCQASLYPPLPLPPLRHRRDLRIAHQPSHQAREMHLLWALTQPCRQ
jgi:hypothetical protein